MNSLPPIREIFAAAIEIESEQARKKYLDETCGQDAGLRAEIEALIQAHCDAGSFFAEDEDQGEGVDDTETPSVTGESAGRTIGPYKLLQQIGEGGMGIVFMAEQFKPVSRRVALKIIKPGLDTKEVIARFEAERQALSMMDHPNIAKVFDAGETENGRPYFVMELVRGVPITNYCDERKLTVRNRLQIFISVCNAVQHAHQKGIIHRDLKPSNILVSQYDDQIVPKVIDFGVAKAITQRLTERTLFTRFGQIVGTFDYMSPEQAQLNQLDVDTRSDVYSLGVILYELLTGQTPFDRQRLRSAALDEILRIIRQEEPLRPSLRLSSSESLPTIAADRHIEPKRLTYAIRGELDWIVMRAMEKDRSRRYETANGLGSDIQRYLADEPVSACPPSPSYQLKKFARRHAALVKTLIAIGCTLIIGLASTTWEAFRADRARARTEQALFELNTSSGLTAAELGRPAEAMLWFANAASIVEPGSQGAKESRIRLRSWSRIVPTPVRTMDHQGRFPISLQFDSTAKLLVTMTQDGTCRVWEIDNQSEPQEVPFKVSAVACNPVAAELAVGLTDGKVRILRLPELAPTHLGDIDLGQPVTSLAYDHAGDRLAVGGTTVKLWDVAKHTFLPVEYRHPLEVVSIRFSGNGKRLLTVAQDDFARLFSPHDTTTNKPVASLPHQAIGYQTGSQNLPHSAPHFVNGDAEVVTGSWGLYDSDQGKSVTRLTDVDDPGSAEFLEVSPSGDAFAICGYGNSLTALWDAKAPRKIATLPKASALAYSPDGSEIAFAAESGVIQRLNASTGHPLGVETQSWGHVSRLIYSPDGRRLIVVNQSGRTIVWLLRGHTSMDFSADFQGAARVVDERSRRVLLGGQGSDLKYSPSHAYLLPRGSNWWFGNLARTRVLSAENLAAVGGPLSPGGLLLDACFSPDEREVALATTLNEITFWDWRTGKRLRTAVRLPSEPLRLLYSADFLHVLCIGGVIHAIDPRSGEIHHSMRHGQQKRLVIYSRKKDQHYYASANGFPCAIVDQYKLEASHDGRWLVTSGIDDHVYVWDSKTGKHRYPPLSLKVFPPQAVLSKDDRYLAVQHKDQVTVFDFETGQSLMSPLCHSAKVSSIRFSDDSNLLAVSLSGNGESWIWNWRKGELVCDPIKHKSLNNQKGVAVPIGENGEYLATAFADAISLWSTRTGRQLSSPILATSQPRTILTSNDDRNVLVTGAARYTRTKDESQFGAYIDVVPLADLDGQDSASVNELRTMAEVVSLQEIRGSSVVLLSESEWDRRFDTIRDDLPAHFPGDWDKDEITAWHTDQFDRNLHTQKKYAARWHLDQLQQRLAANDPRVSKRRVLLQLKLASDLLSNEKPDAAVEAWQSIRDRYATQSDTAATDLAVQIALQMWQQQRPQIADDILGHVVLTSVTPQANLLESLNGRIWDLLAAENVSAQNTALAVTLADKVARLSPRDPIYWNTLGVAHYRNGNWQDAINALEQSVRLESNSQFASNAFFLAMAQAQLGDKKAAAKWYIRGCRWMEKNAPSESDLKRFKAEARPLIGDTRDLPQAEYTDADSEPEFQEHNLITNPSFEARMANGELPGGWNGVFTSPGDFYRYELVSDAHHGATALKIEGKGNWGGVTGQRLPLQTGFQYKAKAWVKLKAGQDATAKLQLSYFDSQVNFLGSHSAALPSDRDGWQLVTVRGVPAHFTDAKFVSAELYLFGDGVAWFDDVEMNLDGEVPKPVNLLVNGDMEDVAGTHPSDWAGVFSEPADRYRCELVSDTHLGKNALKIEGEGGFGWIRSERLPIRKGKQYRAQAWIRMGATRDTKVDVRFVYFDQKGKPLGNHGGVIQPGDSDWQFVSIRGTPSRFPAAQYIGIGLWLVGDGVAWFDDVKMYVDGAEPSQRNYLINGDMEDIAGTRPSGWHIIQLAGTGDFQSETSQAYSGQRCCRVTGSGQWLAARSAPIAIHTGQEFDLEGYVRVDRGIAMLQIDCFGDDGRFLGATQSRQITTKDWQNIKLRTQLAKFPSATRFHILLKGLGDFDACFDELVLTPVARSDPDVDEAD